MSRTFWRSRGSEPASFGAAILVGLWLACGAQADAVAVKFAYVLGCDAQIDKLDLVTGRKVSRIDLGAIPAARPYWPAAKTPEAGCLVDAPQATPDNFSALAKGADGNWRRLTFSLPAFSLSAAAATTEPGEAAATSALDKELLDGAGKTLPAEFLEASGDRRLFRVFAADGKAYRFAVAGAAGGAPVFLDAPARAGVAAHLAPGGGAVFVASARRGEIIGELELYDTASGARRGVFGAPGAGMRFLALTPNGEALLHRGRDFRFVALGERFSDAPVVTGGLPTWPYVFYAAK